MAAASAWDTGSSVTRTWTWNAGLGEPGRSSCPHVGESVVSFGTMNPSRGSALQQLQALTQEVQAQSGKKVSTRAAKLLFGDIEYVMNH